MGFFKEMTSLILFLQIFSNAHTAEPISFILKSMVIEGKTNVNHFHFYYSQIEDKLIQSSRETITFHIPVQEFESSNPNMTEDFQELLQAKTHPKILVDINKDKLIEIANSAKNKKLNLDLFLAGKSKSVESKYTINAKNPDSLVLEGKVHVRLSEFDLVPPQKMFGIIRVQDQIFIKFDVILLTQ